MRFLGVLELNPVGVAPRSAGSTGSLYSWSFACLTVFGISSISVSLYSILAALTKSKLPMPSAPAATAAVASVGMKRRTLGLGSCTPQPSQIDVDCQYILSGQQMASHPTGSR
jgi:hypothetical protein